MGYPQDDTSFFVKKIKYLERTSKKKVKMSIAWRLLSAVCQTKSSIHPKNWKPNGENFIKWLLASPNSCKLPSITTRNKHSTPQCPKRPRNAVSTTNLARLYTAYSPCIQAISFTGFTKLSLKKNRLKQAEETLQRNRSSDLIIIDESFDRLKSNLTKNVSITLQSLPIVRFAGFYVAS